MTTLPEHYLFSFFCFLYPTNKYLLRQRGPVLPSASRTRERAHVLITQTRRLLPHSPSHARRWAGFASGVLIECALKSRNSAAGGRSARRANP